jgi:hypothetical protein
MARLHGAVLIPLDEMFDDRAGAGACRRRGFHDLPEGGVDRSPGLLKLLIVVGAALCLEEARPGGFVASTRRKAGSAGSAAPIAGMAAAVAAAPAVMAPRSSPRRLGIAFM